MRLYNLWIVILVVGLISGPAYATNKKLGSYTVIHAGELLTVPGKKPLKKHSIIIKDNVIEAVKAGFVAPKDIAANASVIDLSDRFVMPGLMDMHVHLQMELGPHNIEDTVKLSNADIGMHSVYYAKQTLLAGFTTVRDLLSRPQEMYALRDGVNKGWIDGPRIIAAAGIAITGGHLDADGMAHDVLAMKSPKTICDGPFECRKMTRHAIKYGADAIKVASTGGVLSDTDTGTGQQMTDNELKEIVDTAHALGRKVASHAHATAGINAALRAGVDSVEHGSYADEETIKLFKQTGAYLVPTLLAGATVVDMAKNSDFMSAPVKAKAIRVGPDMLENFARSYKAGVKIAFGTDSGVSLHGINAQEAVLMHQAGMPAAEILKSATVNAADLIGMSDKLGTITPGKYADIIAVEISPLEDIASLLNVGFVMKDGKVYKQ
ncbi:amidohydrolase family protein [Shewanella intestini]|uniref:Amidohydrolase family protein n=1 Tax=Shewanella intestini TaxID=2017544 RepID=A0ABS5I6Q6_9GAMM|nr:MULTISPECIES: amidohydrolase family protein [Shewanella]MBR9729513.1 amidohydrolase family protein [Shewanella intestini]MRG37558.1 amidohydrolase family protein [Shewanella sp. XMDDZSB0408]